MGRYVGLPPLVKFLLVGTTTVLLDAAMYSALLALGVSEEPAKAAGFVFGALFAYVANWRFTFGARRSRYSELLFVVVYALALLINVTVNALVLGVLAPSAWALPVAFVLATGLSAAWNFVGMAVFVFRRRGEVRTGA